MPVLPGAEPFAAAGSGPLARVGALLLHGFTGSPQSMRPWAEHLAAAGLAVRLPRLPGHGTSWREMQRTRWTDWYAEAERTFDELAGCCDAVFVMGLSMGGTLTLRLAEEKGDAVRGIVTVNASLASQNRQLLLVPVLARLVPSFPGIASDIRKPGVTEIAYDRVPLQAVASLRHLWRVTRADLGRITCPVLAYRSRVDHVVEPVSGELLARGTSAGLVTERVLEDSYHVATLDNDAQTIFAGSVEFVRSRVGIPAP